VDNEETTAIESEIVVKEYVWIQGGEPKARKVGGKARESLSRMFSVQGKRFCGVREGCGRYALLHNPGGASLEVSMYSVIRPEDLPGIVAWLITLTALVMMRARERGL
jgi:hypothetical protein